MVSVLTRVYVKTYSIFLSIINFSKVCKFLWFLHVNNIFRDGNPQLILRVIQKFVELESSNYEESIVMGRDLLTSTKLLSSLIDSYFETKSSVILNQILEVLKIDFVERGNNNVK